MLVSLYSSVTMVNTHVKNKKWHFFPFVKMYNHNEDSSIIETNHRNWQNDLTAFWIKLFSLQANSKKQKEQKWARVDRNKKQLLTYIHIFFLDISHRHYRFGLKGGFCWIVSRFFFFPVEEHYCNAATVNLLRRVRAMKALPSALRVGGSIWTHLSWGCCEVQTISSPNPPYSS